MSSIGFARRQLLRFLIGAGALGPAVAQAQVAQEKVFFDTLFAACNAVVSPTDPLFPVCNQVLVGGLAGGVFDPGLVVANVGSTGSYARAGRGLQRELEDLLGDEEAKKRRKRGGGSGDFTAGPFGGFVTAQASRTDRALTDLENGYDAKLGGLLFGLDRRFGNALVTGASLGHTDTDSTYLGDGGTLSARNTTLMLYATYLPAARAYLGAYLGGGSGTQDATRRVAVGNIFGTVASTSKSRQAMAGLSGGHNWDSGGLSFSVTGGADYVKSRTDETTETGTTGLEFIYPEQTTTSLTGTLGARASYRYAFAWGAIVPSVRAAYFHEFRDDARTVSPQLAVSPSTVFAFQTDAPDRNYYVGGAGATIEMGRGTQIFIDYEKRGGHAFIDTWSASIGLIAEF
jgi:outer membrane autotransporter protein